VVPKLPDEPIERRTFLGVSGAIVGGLADERLWLDGLYLDIPEEWDDPYRFFRW
jgi:hypothetical protein